MTSAPIAALLAILCAALVVCALGWVRSARRVTRAESACEELRKQVMRGSTVVSVARESTHWKADPRVEVVAIAGKYHAFTDSPLPVARDFYDLLVSTRQIQPLPPIQ